MKYNYYRIFGDAIEGFSDLIPEEVAAEKHVMYIGAIDEEQVAAGILAYTVINGTVEILCINVYDELENEGIEDELLSRLLDGVVQSDDLYNIAAVYPDNEDCKYLCRAIDRNSDFAVFRAHYISLITPAERKNSEMYQKLKEYNGKTVKFSDINMRSRKEFYQYIIEKEIAFTDVTDEPYLVDDMSLCTLNEEGEVTSCILFKKHEEGEIELSYMMLRPGYTKDMAVLLAEVARRLDENYPDDLLTVNTVNTQSDSMVEKIFGSDHNRQEICSAFRI